MILYQVDYPFEIDMERGLSDRLYPTLDDAIADASGRFYSRVAEEAGLPADGSGTERSRRPAFVIKVTVRTLDRAAMCEIINTEGGGWRAGDKVIGRITYSPHAGVTFDKGGV